MKPGELKDIARMIFKKVDLDRELFNAVAANKESLTRVLLLAGGDANYKNEEGVSVVKRAKENHNRRIALMLFKHGARVEP